LGAGLECYWAWGVQLYKQAICLFVCANRLKYLSFWSLKHWRWHKWNLPRISLLPRQQQLRNLLLTASSAVSMDCHITFCAFRLHVV
jgi:hypothetical protein